MIAIDWCVRGYHHFQVRPHREIPLKLVLETGNWYNRDAILVKMPIELEIQETVLSQETKPGQTVRQIAGKAVGRVPRGLSSAFRRLVDRRIIRIDEIICTYKGEVRVQHPNGPELLYTYTLSVNRDR